MATNSAGGGDGGGGGSSSSLLLSRRMVWGLTLTNFASFFCLGLLLSMLGPTLLDLAARLDASISHMALVFTARSLGYLLGSIVGGLAFDRTGYSVTMLATTILLAGASSFCVPLAPSVVALALVVSLQGLAMGFLDTGGNMLLIRCWRERCGPYLQALHFFFGVGAFIAPLLAKQFIAETKTIEGTNCTALATAASGTHDLLANSTSAMATTAAATATAFSSSSSTPALASNATTTGSMGMGDGDGEGDAFASHVATAYRIVAGILLPPGIMFLLLSPFTPKDIMKDTGGGGGGGGAAEASPKPRSRVYVVGLLSAAFFFFMLYVGTEVSFGGYLYSYTVKSCDLQFSEHDGAVVTSVYWGLFAIGRFLAIPLSARFSPRSLVIADLSGCLIAAVVMAALPHNATVIWFGSGLFGFSMASVFPSGYHMIETYMDISNAATSILIVGSALGEMLIPLLVGTLFDRNGPDTFLYIIVAVIGVATCVFGFIMCWINHFVSRLGSSSITYNMVGSADTILLHDMGGGAFAIADSSDSEGDFELPPLAAPAMFSDDDDDSDDAGAGAGSNELVYDFAAGEVKRKHQL